MKKRISVILLLTLVLALCLSAVAMATVQLMEVEDETCKHENTVYVDNKDGTHNRVCKACGKVLETKDCVYDLVDAIAKVNDAGGTITMQNDVSGLTKKLDINHSKPFAIILDLNGHTISGACDTGSTFLAVSTYDTVTIRDSSEAKTGKIESTGGGDYAVHVSSGKLIIEGGTFVGTDSGTGTKGRALGAQDAELVNITGGTFKSDVELKNSPVEITGGTFSSLDLQCSSVKISGGTFASLKTDRGKIGGLLEKGYIYESNDGAAVDTFAQSASDVSVVPCPHESADVNPETGECACGMQMTLKTEVKDGETTTTTYGTDIVAVLNNAPKGAVVTLLANVSSDSTAELEISANITIDLNGYTLTYSKNSIDVYYANVAIKGEGSVSGITVYPNSTLNLSGWSGGTIESVNMQDASSGLTSGKGTIGELSLYRSANDKFHNIRLNSGTYNKISKTSSVSVALSELLAEGFVFQAIEDDGYYRSADKFTTLEYVTVVPCPHKNITAGETGGTCDCCGLSNIVATVGDKVYTASDTIEVAVSEWVGERGGTLTLYAAYSKAEFTSFAPAKDKLLTLDLNGFPFNKDTVMTLGGAYLTVLDSRAKTSSQGAGPLTADSGSLTLESGRIKGLTVGAENVVTLMGGSVEGIDCPYPVYKLLANGCALMNGNITVDPTAILSGSTETYTIKDSQNTVTEQGTKTGTVAYGEKNIPLALSLTTADSEIGRMQFEWYAVRNDGTMQRIAMSKDFYPNEDVYTYTFNESDVTSEFVNWNGLSVGEYDVICVVNGKASDGAYRWRTAYGGYKLTVDPADLGEISLTFTQAAADNFFGEPIKGNLGDGSGTFVFCPYGGNPEKPSTLTYCFEVRHNDTLLTEGTDYTIVSGNKASNAGRHTITISGLNNYKGTATTTWTIKPYTLPADAAKVCIDAITKDYDGTTSFDLSNFPLHLSVTEDVSKRGTVNPAIGADNTAISIYLSGSDYTITPITFDSAEAGDRTVTFAVTLKDSGNFVFEGGVKTLNVTKSRDVSILKADAPTLDSAALTVTNELKKTYEVILPAPPALESPKTYGDITYELASDSVKLNDGYYTSGAKIENGKLILPIESVNSTVEGNIGTVTVKVKTTNYRDATITVNVSAKNKLVPVKNNVSATAITYGDKISDSEITGTMTDPNTGKKVNGTFSWNNPDFIPNGVGDCDSGWTFTPEDNETYAVTIGSVFVMVNPKSITGAQVDIKNPVYNGTAQTPTVNAVTLGETVLQAKDYDVLVTRQTDAGSYKLTIRGEGNYTGFVECDWELKQKTVDSLRVDLVPEVDYTGEAIEPTVKVYDNDDTLIPDTEYVLKYVDNTNAGTATVEIRNKEGGNYKIGSKDDSVFYASFTINRAAQTFTAEDITATYGDAPVTIKLSGDTFGDVTYTLANNAPTDVVEIEDGKLTILNTGTAVIMVNAAGDENHEPRLIHFTVTVKAKPLTFRVLDRSAYVGETAPDLSNPTLGVDFELEGLLGNDEIEAEQIGPFLYYNLPDATVRPNPDIEPDMTQPGSYKIVCYSITLSNSVRNYTIGDRIDGTLTIDYAPPATYAVTVAESENGSVTASRRSASRGQTVTLTVTPDEGYALSSLTVTDAKGNAVEVTETYGAYSFKMPGSKVTVAAAFEKIDTEPRFDDVTPDDWFFDDVEWAADEGLVSGVTDTTFDPNSGCTRAHIVTMLWRAAGCPVVNYLMPFTDVAEDVWYTEAIRWAASERIVLGTSDTTFTPDRICNRAQVAVMLYRYAVWAEMDTTQGGMAIREFEDYADIPEYALEPMGWAVNAGILVGSDNRLTPNADCTRAQIAAILHRALGK